MTSTSTPISPSNFPSSDIAPVVMSPAAAAHPPPSQPPSDDETEPLPRPDTPTGRKKEQSKLSPDAKGNVRAAVRAVLGKGHRDDQECFCLVTGFSADKRILNYAHVVPGAMSFDETTKLEWIWGYPHKSLNLDTRWNVHTLTSGLHNLYDLKKGETPQGFFYVPTESALLSIMSLAYMKPPGSHASKIPIPITRKSPQEFYQGIKIFTYHLVPLPAMRMCEEITTVTDPPNKSYHKVYEYPYQDLGPLHMHIPYHYVIINSGLKLETLFPTPHGINFEEYFPWADADLRTCITLTLFLYRAWTGCTPQFPTPSTPSQAGSMPKSATRRSACQASKQASSNVGHPDASGPLMSEDEDNNDSDDSDDNVDGWTCLFP